MILFYLIITSHTIDHLFSAESVKQKYAACLGRFIFCGRRTTRLGPETDEKSGINQIKIRSKLHINDASY